MTQLVDLTLTESEIPTLQTLIDVRTMTAEQFIDRHASGTLRKNFRIGFSWRRQYREERVAYEFGWEFEIQPQSRVTLGQPFTEGDSHACTEAGWHIERYQQRKVFPEDTFEAAYIIVEFPDGTRDEGIGIVVRETSARWVGNENMVYAIIAHWDRDKNDWGEVNNPF